jgi:hypothetical protein
MSATFLVPASAMSVLLKETLHSQNYHLFKLVHPKGFACQQSNFQDIGFSRSIVSLPHQVTFWDCINSGLYQNIVWVDISFKGAQYRWMVRHCGSNYHGYDYSMYTNRLALSARIFSGSFILRISKSKSFLPTAQMLHPLLPPCGYQKLKREKKQAFSQLQKRPASACNLKGNFHTKEPYSQ